MVLYVPAVRWPPEHRNDEPLTQQRTSTISRKPVNVTCKIVIIFNSIVWSVHRSLIVAHTIVYNSMLFFFDFSKLKKIKYKIDPISTGPGFVEPPSRAREPAEDDIVNRLKV